MHRTAKKYSGVILAIQSVHYLHKVCLLFQKEEEWARWVIQTYIKTKASSQK